MTSTRAAFLLTTGLWLVPATASADWYVTPFVGLTFAADTTFLDLDEAAGRTKRTYGGSVAVIGRRVLGIEADFAYTPRFFQRPRRQPLVRGSNVTTFTGNVILAAPVRLTREGLRPYFVGGVGLMHVGIEDLAGATVVDSDLVGFNVGGGVMGFFNERTGVRLEIRHFRNLTEEEAGVSFRDTRLSFWRASAGLVLRR